MRIDGTNTARKGKLDRIEFQHQPKPPGTAEGTKHYFWSRDPNKGFVEVWFDGEQVMPRAMTATLLDENAAFFQIGLRRDTIDVPETIIIDHVGQATTLEEATPPKLAEKGQKPAPTKPE